MACGILTLSLGKSGPVACPLSASASVALRQAGPCSSLGDVSYMGGNALKGAVREREGGPGRQGASELPTRRTMHKGSGGGGAG